MSDILERIARERRSDVETGKRERPYAGLERSFPPPRRPFVRTGNDRAILVAECKRASPSRGLFLERYDPEALARAYMRGGADMISVLTEPRFFLGSCLHLGQVRASVPLPILAKDFILDPWQVRAAWADGADVVLLIAALLDGSRLEELARCAREHGLSTLVEVRDEAEAARALACDPDAIGLNLRDLRDFSVDSGTDRERRALGVLRGIPPHIAAVAESGMKTPRDAVALRRLGYDAFLVGEAFVTAPEPGRAVRAFAEALAAEREGGRR